MKVLEWIEEEAGALVVATIAAALALSVRCCCDVRRRYQESSKQDA
jgi:hypothetical protein